MLIFSALLAEDPSVELYYPLIILLLLAPAAMGLLFSLRVSVGYYIALFAGLAVGDAVMLVPLTFGSGRTTGEAAIAFLLIGLCAIPIAFITLFVSALVLLPKSLLKTVPKKYRAWAFAVSALFVLVPLLFEKSRIDSPEAFAEMVRNHPESLDNKRIGDFFLKDDTLTLEGRTFEGVEFIRSKINSATIRNVTFKNCLFKESDFDEVTLENVTFENCTFARFPSHYSDRHAGFEAVVCTNVVFSGGRLEHLRLNARQGGDVVVKNVKVRAPEGYTRLFGGGALDLRIDNSVFDGDMTLAWTEGHYRATLHVTNSRFTVPKNMLFRCSDMKTVWLENCYFDTGSIASGETMVIKNCHLATGVVQNFRDVTQQKRPESEWRKQTIYVENCEFPAQRSDWGWEYGTTFYNHYPENDIYILGKPPRQKKVNLGLSGGGRMHIFDAELAGLDIRGGDKAPPVELNLKNVVIDGGPRKDKYSRVDFESVILADGKWDDVSIFPQVNMEGADIRALTVHNLQFPKGEPWVNADQNTLSAMKVSETPLDIPRPHVPTLMELGIVDPLETR